MASPSMSSATGSAQAAASTSASSSTAATASAASSAPSLSAKIDALEQDIQDTKTKINARDNKITALDNQIAAAEGKNDAAAAADLRQERQEVKDEAKQLRTMLIGYQHEKNLLLEAQQRAHPSSSASNGQTHMRRMYCPSDSVSGLTNHLSLLYRLHLFVFSCVGRCLLKRPHSSSLQSARIRVILAATVWRPRRDARH
jgi:uncharacterized protein (DUF1800 family)